MVFYMANPSGHIIVALPANVSRAYELICILRGQGCMFKMGIGLLHSVVGVLAANEFGWAFRDAQEAQDIFRLADLNIFCDSKIHEIPHETADAVEAVARYGVKFVSVHATSGSRAFRAAVDHKGAVQVLGVTVLTSFDDLECKEIFGTRKVKQKVFQLTHELVRWGADGVVCSGQELKYLFPQEFSHLTRVVPGIRPAWAPHDDQRRIVTPEKAILAGADYLVIGRPISTAQNPRDAYLRIADEVDSALEKKSRS